MADEVDISWSDVAAMAPELGTVPVSAQEAILTQVVEEVRPSVWSAARARLAAVWLAAHLGALSGKGSSPVLQSVTAGSVSRTFATGGPNGQKEALMQTRYGQEFLRLQRKWLPHGAVL